MTSSHFLDAKLSQESKVLLINKKIKIFQQAVFEDVKTDGVRSVKDWEFGYENLFLFFHFSKLLNIWFS